LIEIEFSDGVVVRARLRGSTLDVPAYTTARGTKIARKRWRLRVAVSGLWIVSARVALACLCLSRECQALAPSWHSRFFAVLPSLLPTTVAPPNGRT
jgi:hypothetical protein